MRPQRQRDLFTRNGRETGFAGDARHAGWRSLAMTAKKEKRGWAGRAARYAAAPPGLRRLDQQCVLFQHLLQ